MKYIFILLLLFQVAYADDDQLVVDGALGVLGSRGSSLSQNKFAKIGVQEELTGPFQERFNIGEWLDSRGEGYSNSFFTGYQIGYEITNEVFQMSLFTGPTLIGEKDSELGGHFQFNETIFFGIVNKFNDSIGLSYNHFSSAGLESPNFGRDYMGLSIKFPF